MTDTEFWAIIQRTFDQSSGEMEHQAELLREELASLSPAEIQAFDHISDARHQQAYSWDLWGAAYIINGGCSDDGFWYFLHWLVSRGQAWYERALLRPDSLADYPGDLSDGQAEFEDFDYVAHSVYEKITGAPMPEDAEEEPLGEPSGTDWEEENEAALQARWPKLFAKYWAQ